MKYGLTLALSENCNMNCTYCYQDNKINKNMKSELVEVISKYINNENFNHKIKLFGGEPTLNMNMVKVILDKFPNEEYLMVSNGVLIEHMNSDDINILKQIDNLCISLEGTNDAYKVIRNKNNVKYMVNMLYEKGLRNITINLSVNGLLLNNLNELKSNIDFIHSKNYNIHWYNLRTIYDYFNSNEDWFELMMWFKDNYYYYYLYILNITKEEDVINGSPESEDFNTFYMCGLDNALTIRWDGSISPCMYHKDIQFNNNDIKKPENAMANLIDKFDNTNNYRCKNCSIKNKSLCHISCSAFLNSITDKDIDKLNILCDRELLRQQLRIEEWESNGDKIRRLLEGE